MLKLLKRDIHRWGIGVEVEAVGVRRLFELRVRKLLLSVVGHVAPLGFYAIEVLSKHLYLLAGRFIIPRGEVVACT